MKLKPEIWCKRFTIFKNSKVYVNKKIMSLLKKTFGKHYGCKDKELKDVQQQSVVHKTGGGLPHQAGNE